MSDEPTRATPDVAMLLPTVSPDSALGRHLTTQLRTMRDQLPASPLRDSVDDVLCGRVSLRAALHNGPLATFFTEGARRMREDLTELSEADRHAAWDTIRQRRRDA